MADSLLLVPYAPSSPGTILVCSRFPDTEVTNRKVETHKSNRNGMMARGLPTEACSVVVDGCMPPAVTIGLLLVTITATAEDEILSMRVVMVEGKTGTSFSRGGGRRQSSSVYQKAPRTEDARCAGEHVPAWS